MSGAPEACSPTQQLQAEVPDVWPASPASFPSSRGDADADADANANDEQQQHSKRLHPLQRVNCCSYITFAWLSPLLKAGARRPLQQSHLYELRDVDCTQHIMKEFVPYWNHELITCKLSATQCCTSCCLCVIV
jgi:hypothetical protein